MLNKRYLAVAGSAVVLAFFSLFAGCRHKTHIVRLIVHGPVVTAATNEKTIILAPSDPLHLLAAGYPSLEEATSTPCGAGTYKFKLEGIEPAEKKAGGSDENDHRIDPAFEAITFTRPNWQPLGQSYFVTMDLPVAARIVALGPLYKVQFSRPGEDFVPLTQMLEFEARDSDDVRLVRTCGSDKKEYKTLSCKEMRARYDNLPVMPKETRDPDAPKIPEQDYIDFALKSCADDASYLFVGIGTRELVPGHGLAFFNKKILPEIFGGEDKVPPDKKLVEHDRLHPNGGSGSDNDGVRLIRASFGGEYPQYVPVPRYVPVTMIENCTSPGGFVRP